MYSDCLHSKKGIDRSNQTTNVFRLIARFINCSAKQHQHRKSNLLWVHVGPYHSSCPICRFYSRGKPINTRWVHGVYRRPWEFSDKRIRWSLSQLAWCLYLYLFGWETTYNYWYLKRHTLGETARNSREFRVRITAIAETDPDEPLFFGSTSLFFWSVWSRGGNIGVSCR